MPWPSDDEDLPADYAFAEWLGTLDPLVVIQDLLPPLTRGELAQLDYSERRNLTEEYRILRRQLQSIADRKKQNPSRS